MLTVYDIRDGGIHALDDGAAIGDRCCWVDLRSPTLAEEELVERTLQIDIPPRANLQELETSRRLRQENGATYFTATILVKVDTIHPVTTTITWILTRNAVVTVRYSDSRALSRFAELAASSDRSFDSEVELMAGMLEAIVARQADLVEIVQAEIDDLSHSVFSERAGHPVRKEYGRVLREVGRAGEVASRAREALVSLDRLVGYFMTAVDLGPAKADVKVRLKVVGRDLKALKDHVDYLSEKVTLLLDATLGLIDIQQNNVIKMLSIVATIFLPPTLIASIFGMNFKEMDVLNWPFGYPLALAAMVVSGVLPLLVFRWRKWL